MEKIIEINNVSMEYTLSKDKISSLKEFIVKLLKRELKFEKFVALNDISFDVYKGEVVGLIGHNGAGKSTLLKIISGILKPTNGNVYTYGSIVPMLELGSGFDMDMTGRENIYLNGTILGYSKKDLDSKFNDIVEFSELKDFLDVPLRNYSSGMIARLAFSVATIVNPEILIVDEILSVGDFEFQKKSFNKMNEMLTGGATVLLVNHDVEVVKKMCNRVVWIEHGKIKMIGNPNEVCECYLASSNKE